MFWYEQMWNGSGEMVFHMKKKTILICILLLSVGLLSGCVRTVLSGTEKGTVVDVRLEEGTFFDEEKVVIEFGNNSKAILKFERYDKDGIDWYEYFNEHIGDYVSINWFANSEKAQIMSVEILKNPEENSR